MLLIASRPCRLSLASPRPPGLFKDEPMRLNSLSLGLAGVRVGLRGCLKARARGGREPLRWRPGSRVERGGGLVTAPRLPSSFSQGFPSPPFSSLSWLVGTSCDLHPGALTHPVLTHVPVAQSPDDCFGCFSLQLPLALCLLPGIPHSWSRNTGSRKQPPTHALHLWISWETLRLSPKGPRSPTHLSSA